MIMENFDISYKEAVKGHDTEDHASSSTNPSATYAAINSPTDRHLSQSHTYPLLDTMHYRCTLLTVL